MAVKIILFINKTPLKRAFQASFCIFSTKNKKISEIFTLGQALHTNWLKIH